MKDSDKNRRYRSVGARLWYLNMSRLCLIYSFFQFNIFTIYDVIHYSAPASGTVAFIGNRCSVTQNTQNGSQENSQFPVITTPLPMMRSTI